MKALTIILSGLMAVSVSGCAVTTAGVKKGDERNFARSVNDVTAGRAISARMNRAYDFDLDKVDVEVAEGIAVLTGRVSTEKDRQEAERIARSAPHVIQVGNEIQISDKTGLVRGGKDSLVGTRVRTRLIAEKNVKARNINIETYDGTVYLLGVARDAAELERIAYIASTTKGVKDVVSYIRLAGLPVTQQAGYRAPSQIMPQQPLTEQVEGYDRPMLRAPISSAPVPRTPSPNLPTTPQSAQRALPDFLTRTPQGQAPSAGPSGTEPYYRDPVTGEQIILPPGTKTIPYDPSAGTTPLGGTKVGDAPFYIDPSNGKKVQIVWTGN